jgi:hypothetical protein
MAKFFVDAMGMKMIQKRKNNAIDLSDGSVNITVLPLRAGTPDGAPTKQPGIDHIGFTAENDQEQFRMMEAAGAKKAGAINLGTAARHIMRTNSSVPRKSSSTWATGKEQRRSINSSVQRSRFQSSKYACMIFTLSVEP